MDVMNRDTSGQNVTRMQRQTKVWIKDALLELLKTYSFDEITIRQIVQTAEISRPTFYRLYKSKSETLNEATDDIWKGYAKEIVILDPKSFDELLHDCLNYFQANHDAVKILIDAGLLSYLTDRATSIFIGAISQESAIWRNWKTPLQKTIGVQFAFGGLLNVLLNWIATDCREPADDLVENIQAVIANLND
jgi:AcrR family transcriptional regulator